MHRLITRIAVFLLGEKRVAAYLRERTDLHAELDTISLATGRLCSVVRVERKFAAYPTPMELAQDIAAQLDSCTAAIVQRYGDTASLRDSFRNAPHSCYNREHPNGKEKGSAR